MSNKSIEFKIQKLIEKAQSSDSIHESEAFMLKAQQLLQEYNLEMSQIMNRTISEEGVIEEHIPFTEDWEVLLMSYIAQNNFCKSLRSNFIQKIFLFGKRENIHVVEYLYSFFRGRVLALSVQSYKQYLDDKMALLGAAGKKIKPPSTFQKNYIRDYVDGAVEGIRIKMAEQKAAAAQNPDMRGLMKVNDDAVAIYISKKYSVSYGRSKGGRSREYGDGYENGVKDGRQINVHSGITQK